MYISEGRFSHGHMQGHMGGAQGYDNWQGQGQGNQNKKKVNIDEQVDQYYQEELMEKLVKVKGVRTKYRYHLSHDGTCFKSVIKDYHVKSLPD